MSPAVEVVEGLVDSSALHEDLVEVAYQFDGIAHLQVAVMPEEVADGNVCRTSYGLGGQTCQFFIEEQRGAFIGENYSNVAQVSAVFGKDVFCYESEKWSHIKIMCVGEYVNGVIVFCSC